MRIVATLKNQAEIAKLIQLGVDVFLLETSRFSRTAVFPLEYNEIQSLTEMIHQEGKQAYVILNTMIHESDLLELQDLLLLLKQIAIDGIVCYDFTVSAIASTFGLMNKIIYQPGTMNTHSLEVPFLASLGMKGITISREITINEIETIIRKNVGIEFSLVGHGYLDMFYSRRKLLTHFFDHSHLQLKADGVYHIQEDERPNDWFPIVEDRFGTHVFRAHKLASFAFLPQLQNGIADFFVARFLLTDEEYYDAISAYRSQDGTQFQEKYADGYDTGFYLLKTEMKKGDRL